MSSPEIASATKPSLGQDWLNALRYWLRGRRGVVALIVSALMVGGALNWSWLVAVGIAPVLWTVLPCAAMCGLGLCMDRMTGGSCSTSSGGSDHVDASRPNVAQRIAATSQLDERDSLSVTAAAAALPDLSAVGAVEPQPDQQPQVREARE